MRYSAEHKRETRTRILSAAGRLFRQEGYGGAGIDGLTKAAGVTNGAFYGHFKSKSEAFRTSVLAGMEELRQGIADLQTQQGKSWLAAFIHFYLGQRRTCDIAESCALQSLSPEVIRADAETRAAFEAVLRQIVQGVAAGLEDGTSEERDDAAIALLALLSGGVTLARAVSDPALSERIGEAVARAARSLTDPAQALRPPPTP